MAFSKRKSNITGYEGRATRTQVKPAHRHSSSHAASDSIGRGGCRDTSQDRDPIASRNRIQSSSFEKAIGNALYAQSIARQVVDGSSSPPTHSYMDRTQQAPDGDTARIIDLSPRRISTGSVVPRDNSDYFARMEVQSRPSSFWKAEEVSRSIPYHSSDSGYESAATPLAAESSEPRLQNFPGGSTSSFSYITSSTSELLRIEGERCRKTPDNHSCYQDVCSHNYPSSPLSSQGQSATTLSAEDDDSNSGYHISSSASRSPKLELQDHREAKLPQNTPEAFMLVPKSCTSEPESRAEESEALPLPSSGASFAKSTKTPISVSQSLSQALSAVNALVSEQPSVPILEKITSTARSWSSTMPPLSVLEGFKVNKKGQILDEEGDLIGELVKGDLLDCVRQKVNAKGEVLDGCGNVVGLARTTARQQISSMTTPSFSGHGAYTWVPHQRKFPRLRLGSGSLQHHRRATSATNASYRYIHPALRTSRESEPVDVPYVQDDDPYEPIRPLNRSSSERTLSELSMSSARPAMSVVPEDCSAINDNKSDQAGRFSYKGRVIVTDRPISAFHTRSQFPVLQSNHNIALIGPKSGNSILSPPKPAVWHQASRIDFAAGTTGATVQLTGEQRHSVARWSYSADRLTGMSLFSDDLGAERRNLDRNSLCDNAYYVGSASVGPATTTTDKPRTYFTHAGRINTDANAPKPSQPEAVEVPPLATKNEIKVEKKKKLRMSFGFGRKGER